MRSEQQHIDDFFRKKEEEYQQGTGDADNHWQQMKALLTPGVTPTPKGYRLQTTRRIIKYLGGFTVVTIITLVTLTTIKTKKKAPAEKPLANKTMAAPQKQQAAKTTVTARNTASVPVKSTTARTVVKKATPAIPVNMRARATATQPAQRKINSQPESQPIPRTTNTQPVTDQPPAPVKVSTLAEEWAKDSAAAANAVTNTATNATTAMQQLNAFYKQLEKAGQLFVIDANKDTTLVAREGTRLTIPAQAFANKKGVIKEGIVTIVLREYYTYEDILAAKLTTTSGGEQLISGGMVHIAADVNGEPVNVAARKNIKLEMPTTKYDEQMQLFRGMRSSLKNAFVAKFMDNRMIDTVRFMKREADENGDLDWIPEGQEQRLRLPESRTIKLLDLYDDPFRIVHGSRKIKAWFYIAPECPYSDEEMKTKLKEHANGYFDKVKVKRINSNMELVRTYGEDPAPVAGDSVKMTFQQALRKRLLTPEDSLRFVEKFKQDSISRENRIREMKKYSFTITNLGWFNCDRNNNLGPRVMFAFNPGKGFEPTTMVSHLVFTRYRSVMPGSYKDNKIGFGRVPKDESVKIVCIGIKNGRVMACIQALTTDKEEIGDLAFEETTPEQFRQKLQTLGLALP